MSETESQNQAASKHRPGRELKKIREQAGLSLKQIAERTLISEARLQALENDDYANVGSVTYVTGYTRAYAKVVGFDATHHIAAFEEAIGFEREQVLPANTEWSSAPKPDRSKYWLLVAALMLALAVVVVVFTLLTGGSKPSTSSATPSAGTNVETKQGADTTSVVDQRVPVINEEPVLESGQTTSSIPLSVSERRASDANSSEPDMEAEYLDLSDVTPAAQTEAVSEPEPEPEPEPATRELVFEFTDECWLRVIDANGSRLADTVKSAGDRLVVEGKPPFYVKLGNSRAVDAYLEGQAVEITPRAGYRTLELSIGE